MKRIQMTLVLIHEHPRVLLGMKKRGFGEGRWNGFGGKVLDNESIEEAAIREMKEEVGINVTELDKRGVIDFEFQNKPGEILEVHFFLAKKYEGEPIESEEMLPKWFHVDNVPFHEMWPDDSHWMPLFFEGKRFIGRIFFKDQNTILENGIKVVE